MDPTGLCVRNEKTSAFCDVIAKSDLSSELVNPTNSELSYDEVTDLYKEVNFDPNGQGDFGAIVNSGPGPVGAAIAAKYGAENSENAENIPGQHNGKGDAVRHAEASIRLTRLADAETAKYFGDAHEAEPNQPVGEGIMDLINNNNGRVIAQIFPNADPAILARAALNAGLLQTSPVRVKR